MTENFNIAQNNENFVDDEAYVESQLNEEELAQYEELAPYDEEPVQGQGEFGQYRDEEPIQGQGEFGQYRDDEPIQGQGEFGQYRDEEPIQGQGEFGQYRDEEQGASQPVYIPPDEEIYQGTNAPYPPQDPYYMPPPEFDDAAYESTTEMHSVPPPTELLSSKEDTYTEIYDPSTDVDFGAPLTASETPRPYVEYDSAHYGYAEGQDLYQPQYEEAGVVPQEAEVGATMHDAADSSLQSVTSFKMTPKPSFPTSEIDDGQRNIFERVRIGSDTIEKIEGDPKPFGFIDAFDYHPTEAYAVGSRYQGPVFEKDSLEHQQVRVPEGLVPGTGEKPPNVNPKEVLTTEESETYILNLNGIEDDEAEELRKQQESIDLKASNNFDYLKNEIGIAITRALAEIVAKKPKDPIHYLGHWLFKWRYNQDFHQAELNKINELILIRENL